MLFSLKIALLSLSTHKLRTVLAMLGVFLGALALTGVRHISEAMVRKAEIEVEKLGPNLFMAGAGRIAFGRGDGGRGAAKTFTMADAEALLAGLPAAAQGAPYVASTMPVRFERSRVMCQLVATTSNYPFVRNFTPQYGRFFTQEELESKAKVCVLGRKIADRLFHEPEAALGKFVFVFRAQLLVIGVMEEKGADISGTDQDEQVFTPITTFMRRMANQIWISGVYVQLESEAAADPSKSSATAMLRSRHRISQGQREDFSVLTAKDTMVLKQQALDLVGTLGFISSSLSFAVGGLGILSIMILLVRARRLEIGVRRAMGARRVDIVRQFLFESGLMSVAGGGMGVLCALALLLVVYRLGDFPYVFDLALIAQALGGSAVLGLAAGAYPAWQAANVEILEVLRNKE
jgi:putative ABC transport system permease protein